jgi:hypothetical protein
VDINKILDDLGQERDQLDLAITSLERLALGGARRRGRPPAWMAAMKSASSTASGEPKARGRGRPPGSKNKSAEATPPATQ